MQAIVVHALGDPEVLTLRAHPVPEPGPGEVLVRLQAVGVNFSDTERRRGSYDPPALPWIPGNEAAGIVEALGAGVEPDWLGRRVAFWAPHTSGAYAEYTVAPANALFSLLDGLDIAVAAALPAQGLTAYGLAHFATALSPGQTALVHAAAGGVGALLVQLLVRRGVRVFGTASSDAKRESVRQLGAIPLSYDFGAPGWCRGDRRPGRGRGVRFRRTGYPGREPGGAGTLRAPGVLRRGQRVAGAGHPDELYPETSGSAASGWPPSRPSAGTPRAASCRSGCLAAGSG
jgi:NADPH:quinone reductase and related Zn-dependent oxidoreductases